LAKNGRGIIVSPTRSGKSLILAGLFHNTLLQSQKNEIKNILLVVPNLLLVEQFIHDLEDYYSIKEEIITITL
jgi:superfamily II DNA or RNA helicase